MLILANRAILLFLLFVLSTYSVFVQSDEKPSEKPISMKIDEFLSREITDVDMRYSPLLQIKSFSMPSTVSNVREALAFVLAGSGFTLNSQNLISPENAQIVSASIPHIQRVMTDISVIEALKVIIGGHHDILLDPISREIGFGLNEYGLNLSTN